MARTRRLAANLAASIVATGISLVVGEVVLRGLVTLPLQRTDPEVRYIAHPVRRFTLAPSHEAFTYGARATVDERGFRRNGSEGVGAATILALGDSFTFGLGVPDDRTWPAQLEAQLAASSISARVVNAGTISYGVFQELDLLRSTGLRIAPRVVIHGLYWNDYMNAGPPSPGAPPVVTPDGYFTWDRPSDTRGVIRRGLSWAFSRSALLYSIRRSAAGFRSGRRTASDYGTAYDAMLRDGLSEANWATIEQFYRDLQAEGRAHNFSILSVIMPVNDIVARVDRASHPYASQARQRLSALEVPFVDTFGLWPAGREGARCFLPQGPDAHLNGEGYRLVAAAVADALRREPKISARLATTTRDRDREGAAPR